MRECTTSGEIHADTAWSLNEHLLFPSSASCTLNRHISNRVICISISVLLNMTARQKEDKSRNRRGEIQFLWAMLLVVLTRLAGFYQCSFSVNLEKSEPWSGMRCNVHTHCALVGLSVFCVHCMSTNEWICSVNSLWIWLCRVGACVMCGLFSLLMLLAQNLLTQTLRAPRSLLLLFVIFKTMKHMLRCS